jgi:hypothetical protein
MTTELHTILEERYAKYGSFQDVADRTRMLLAVFPRRDDLPPVLSESLHMICNKLARIACGDPMYEDSWRDIAGYAMLATQWLEDYNGQVEKRLT